MTEKWDFEISDDELEGIFKKYCRDFTALARAGRFDPITGRDKEIDEAILVLLQKGRKNVCLLAPAGVGKTALVAGLAQRIVKGDVPDYLKNARVLEIELSRMAAGTNSRADFNARFMPLCKGVSERYHHPELPRIILFIDEIHQIMPNCEGSAFKGLSDTMKPYLTIGDLLTIGATTLDEYRMYLASDGALDRRFQKIYLNPPNVVKTYRIFQSLRPGFEKHHRLTISNDLLLVIAHLTEEHMRKRNQPDKSIITMDAAMAYHVKMHGINQELGLESVYYMISRETTLNRNALHDEKLIQELAEKVKKLESGEVAEKPKDDNNQHYDPAKNRKNLTIDPSASKH